MARIVDREDALERLPKGNLIVDPRKIHMEVVDNESRLVWLAPESLEAGEFESFEPEPPFMKTAAAVSPMDLVAFRRSPGQDEDGAVIEREIGGRRFILVAMVGAPPERPFGPDGPVEIWVRKHQTVGFDAGSPLAVLRSPDGNDFVQQTGPVPKDGELALPLGWALRVVALREPLTIEMQDAGPTTYWFPRTTSFQGPVQGLPDAD